MSFNINDTQPLVPINGLSLVHGRTDVPLLEWTIDQMLKDTVAKFPSHKAAVFRHQDLRYSWREFDFQVDLVAAGLMSQGIVKGDRVGIWSTNRAEWVLVQFATARIGAILVNINPAYRLVELEYSLNKVQCKALVTARAFRKSNYLDMLLELAPELKTCRHNELVSARLPHLKLVVALDTASDYCPGLMPYSQLILCGESFIPKYKSRLPEISRHLSQHDPINIQFTSGTTGLPKCATLTHRNLVNNSRFTAAYMEMTPNDLLCIPVPLYHCFGMVMAVLACVSTGCAMVFPSDHFDAGLTLEAVSEEQCTLLHGVPTMFIAELNHPELTRFKLKQLRSGIIAGAPCPVETMRQLSTKMNLTYLTIAYGMTETSPISFQTTMHDSIENRTETVGQIQPHLQCKVIDPEGNIVKVGEVGQLCTKGYSVMLGYWGDEAKTKDSIKDGWMETGDLATIDSKGYCRIVGRCKDMLIRGGENIYPREIEEYLFQHPKVESVQVFGVPDPLYGEESCAWILLKGGSEATVEEIKEFCRGRIAHYKVPRYIKFVNQFPMTVSGKVQKYLMREQMIEEIKSGAVTHQHHTHQPSHNTGISVASNTLVRVKVNGMLLPQAKL
ncbi:hypothetical protein SAMD00019534_022060 [Acytostelium subglobosum LB1]|uniref:hypothetical protein n=1 Tax=Acytostelium subglobosum LB1 TaxID=1410327 RepID=UPI0006449982|nr:hypothetical protein SAMD00019534_022060 [Acytostelium subglobosum LB1]GAM19031.1 hypothetical protein SAMD00019534_022060 [Acytostelium subglobosum LB1]|eukprot:XP_012756958.1 hypothetical protein SAMD00019534_022060 [Acytostelium subglobosum LB1]